MTGPVKSRFDGSGDPKAPYSTTLSSLLRSVLRAHSRSLRICLPAQVEAVHSDYSVDVRPGFLEVHGQAPQPTAMPLLPSVPVSMPHGAKFSIRFPVSVGDTGYVLIADRCIDTWLLGSGSAVDPRAARTHDLTDAIFVPGLMTTTAASAAQDGTTDLTLSAGAAKLRIQQLGHFVISNGAVDLVDQVQQLAAQVAALSSYMTGATLDPVTKSKIINTVDPTGAAVAGTRASAVAASVGTLKGS